MSLGSPLGAPAFTQATMVLISFSVRERSFEKCPKMGSANHGGMIFCCTTRFMLGAQGRVCSYVSTGNGAASPGRWQVWQFFWRMGATSLVKVTLVLLAVWLNEQAVKQMARTSAQGTRPTGVSHFNRCRDDRGKSIS